MTTKKTHAIIVDYPPKKGVSPQTFQRIWNKTYQQFWRKQPGFIRAELFWSEDDQRWYEIIQWKKEKDAMRATDKMMNTPFEKELTKYIDFSNVGWLPLVKRNEWAASKELNDQSTKQ